MDFRFVIFRANLTAKVGPIARTVPGTCCETRARRLRVRPTYRCFPDSVNRYTPGVGGSGDGRRPTGTGSEPANSSKFITTAVSARKNSGVSELASKRSNRSLMRLSRSSRCLKSFCLSPVIQCLGSGSSVFPYDADHRFRQADRRFRAMPITMEERRSVAAPGLNITAVATPSVALSPHRPAKRLPVAQTYRSHLGRNGLWVT